VSAGLKEERDAVVTPARRWRLPAILVLVAIVLVVVIRWRATRSGEDARGASPAARTVPVVAEPAQTADVPVYLDGIGSVTPLATVTVRTRVDGQLLSVPFREGDTVRAGDVLAEIDPRPFEVQRTQALGARARDLALLENAKVDVKRYQMLVKQEAVPRQQLDTQVALVHQYEGAVQADQGQIDDAELQLTYCHITAPTAGRLGLRLVDPGNIVHASDAGGLVVITQMQPIDVVFTLPEDSLPPVLDKLRTGGQLAVEAYDREKAHKLATGALLTVDNAIDPGTGTVRLKAEFPNDDGGLFPNQFVNARLLLDVHHGATTVPTVAIQRGVQGTFVYVVGDDHVAHARPIKVGVNESGTAAVDSGLNAGEMVVVDGAGGLRDGSPVTSVAKDGKAPAAGHS
jgi:multidrug efflux system membrane fusion protein